MANRCDTVPANVFGGSAEPLDRARHVADRLRCAGAAHHVRAAADLEKPDLSILSDEFLERITATDRPNLQMELSRRLLADQIRIIRRENLVQSRRFSDLLDAAINRYQNRALSTAKIIAAESAASWPDTTTRPTRKNEQ